MEIIVLKPFNGYLISYREFLSQLIDGRQFFNS